jgi:hypothetical protein
VYLRRDGRIIAAKFLGLEDLGSYKTYLNLVRADGVHERLYVGNGAPTARKSMYRTIEDAIHDNNKVAERYWDISFIMEEFGMYRKVNQIGCTILGKDMWRWDGYQSKCSHMDHQYFKIVWDGEWHCDYIGRPMYYDSKEKCIAANHVDVVTF